MSTLQTLNSPIYLLTAINKLQLNEHSNFNVYNDTHQTFN